MIIIAQTPQFVIRSYQPQDEAAYLNMFSDTRVSIHLPQRTEEENRQLFQESMAAADEPFNRWSIVTPADEYLGMCMLRQLPDHPADELVIGYSLAFQHWNKGLATAVVAELCKYGFGFEVIQKLEAVTTTDNVPSQKVLLKAGFRECGITVDDDVQLIKFEKQRNS